MERSTRGAVWHCCEAGVSWPFFAWTRTRPGHTRNNYYFDRLRVGWLNCGRGTTRAEDAQGTPTQSNISPSILVYEDKSDPCCKVALGDAQGIVCMILLFLNIFSAHCAARLMGYKYTSRKTVMIINVMGFFLGLMLTILGLAPAPSEVPFFITLTYTVSVIQPA